MPGRRRGVLLPLEESILEIALERTRRREPDFHGFAVAEQLGSGERATELLAFGTLYKALGRLERDGLLTSAWEDVDPVAAGRPRRRLYRATPEASAALTASKATREPAEQRTQRWSPA